MHMRAQCRADGYGLRTHTHPNHPSPKAAKGKHNMDHQRVRHGVILSHGSHGCKNYNIQMSCNGQKTSLHARKAQGIRAGAHRCRGGPRNGPTQSLARVNTATVRKLYEMILSENSTKLVPVYMDTTWPLTMFKARPLLGHNHGIRVVL